jgi:hypothetical protein
VSAVPQRHADRERRLRLVTEVQPVPTSWRFVMRGALTAMVLGAVAVIAVVLSTTRG